MSQYRANWGSIMLDDHAQVIEALDGANSAKKRIQHELDKLERIFPVLDRQGGQLKPEQIEAFQDIVEKLRKAAESF